MSGWGKAYMMTYLIFFTGILMLLPIYNDGVTQQSGENWDDFSPNYNFNAVYSDTNITIIDTGTYSYTDPPVCDDMGGVDKWIGCGAGYIGFMFNSMFFDPPAGLEVIGFIFIIATIIFAITLLTELVLPAIEAIWI